MHTYSSIDNIARRTVELRSGFSLLRHSQSVWLTIFMLGIPLAILAVVMFLSMTSHGETLHAQDVWDKFLLQMEKDSKTKWHVILFVSLFPLAVISIWAQRLAYIRFTPHCIEGYIPKWTGQVIRNLNTGHWQVLWDSIRSARIVPGKQVGQLAQRIAGYRLVLETDKGEIRISPFLWVLRNGPDHRLTLSQMLNEKKVQPTTLIEGTPLIQILRQRGIKFEAARDDVSAAAGPSGFDLTKHHGLLIEIVLFFVAALYALIDGLFINAFRPLESLPLMPFMFAAVAAFVLVSILGRGAPAMERVVVGLLTMAAITAAVYPGLLRINAISAEPQSIIYRSVEMGRFEPVDRDAPMIDLIDLNIDEYWQQYPPGTEREFQLLHGAGGFYQMDLRPLFKQTRDFYSKKG